MYLTINDHENSCVSLKISIPNDIFLLELLNKFLHIDNIIILILIAECV